LHLFVSAASGNTNLTQSWSKKKRKNPQKSWSANGWILKTHDGTRLTVRLEQRWETSSLVRRPLLAVSLFLADSEWLSVAVHAEDQSPVHHILRIFDL
jgi:hypothetical protein